MWERDDRVLAADASPSHQRRVTPPGWHPEHKTASTQEESVCPAGQAMQE